MELETSERSPSLAEVVRRHISADRADLHVAIPAVVTKYDEAKQMVSVKPLIKEAYIDEDDQRQVESRAIITGVPVIFQGATGGFRITFPISDGSLVVDGSTLKATTGLLIFADRSIDKWLSGSGQEVDPGIDHEHAQMDAVFVPGLNPFGAPWKSAPKDHATAGVDGGKQIHFRKDTICVGDEANAQFVALAQKVLDELNKIASAYNAHTHVVTGTCPGGTGGALTAGLAAKPASGVTPAAVASSQAKAAT